MSKKDAVTGSLVLSQAEQLQFIAVSPERADELSREVQHLNANVDTQAEELDFDHEPLAYTATMRRLASEQS